MKLFGSKRAISPLVATVLLIAFSVSLGAVVMTWGESYVEDKAEFVRGVQEIRSGCDATRLSIITLDGEKQACYRPNLMEMTVENGPSTEIYDIKVAMIGSDGVYNKESIIDKNIGKASIIALKFGYEPIGPVKKVKLIPKIKVGNDIVLCADQGLVIDSPRVC